MRLLDTSSNEHIAVLVDMVRKLSDVTDHRDVLRIFSEGMRQIQAPRSMVSVSTRNLPENSYKITRVLHAEDLGQALEKADPWGDWEQLPVHSGGLIGGLIARGEPALIHDLYLKDDPALGDTVRAYGSAAMIPLFDRGRVFNWVLMLMHSSEGFSIEELEEAVLHANLVGGTTRRTLIAKELKDANERVRFEVARIGRIQQSLLPVRLPHVSGMEIAADHHAYDEAGGDIYDLLPRWNPRNDDLDGPPPRNTPWLVLMADASGHGPAATVVSAMLHAMIRSHPDHSVGPGALLDHANYHLARKPIASTFITAFLAVYDPRDRSLRYARAGHPPPVLKLNPGVGGEYRMLDEAGDLPLGVTDHEPHQEACMTLKRGQTLVLYTDGIPEALDAHGREFGLSGIQQAVSDCIGEPGCVLSSIWSALRRHEAGIHPGDDQTLMAMQLTAPDLKSSSNARG